MFSIILLNVNRHAASHFSTLTHRQDHIAWEKMLLFIHIYYDIPLDIDELHILIFIYMYIRLYSVESRKYIKPTDRWDVSTHRKSAVDVDRCQTYSKRFLAVLNLDITDCTHERNLSLFINILRIWWFLLLYIRNIYISRSLVSEN